MATEETALQTSVTTADPSPSAVGVSTPADTLVGDTGVGQVATAALDQATPAVDQLDQIITGIPENDTDLATITDQSQRELVTNLRGQLRVLGGAVRELTPLRALQQFGDPAAVQSRLEYAKLLYSPVMGSDGKPVVDPSTRTTFVTTVPLWKRLDKDSPGLPEQAFADLALFRPTDEAGQPMEPLGDQYLRYLQLNPARISEYRNIDALIARTSGAITPDELAEIPTEYHAAYRTIPPSIRNAWKSYDEADQARLLEDYKGKVDAVTRDADRIKTDAAAKARADQAHAQTVATEQDKYLDTVRRERTTSLIQSLAQQVTFSTDPINNRVMLGSLAATMAQLLDPQWRFVVADEVLAPLGLKLDHTFDQALTQFDTSASDSVALRMAGDIGRADQAKADSVTAANQLMAKIAIFALKVAARQGATVAEKAVTQAAALATAASGRPGAGNGSGPSVQGGVLPPGMVPGSREATDYLARQTGFLRDTP